MTRIVAYNPFRCRMWDYHDRLDETITENTCSSEIASVLTHGQQVPVLGRLLKNDPAHDVELIFGARRLFVAKHLNVSIKVEIREITNRDAIIVMDIENRQRKDISAYERGISYARWLRSGHFESQDEIAKALKISASQVSRLLKIAKLPSVIIGAFRNPSDLRECWGLELFEAWQDCNRRHALADRARAIARAEQRPAPDVVYGQLMAGTPSQKRPVVRRDEIVLDGFGKPLFRIRHKSSLISLMIPVKQLSHGTVDQIKRSLIQTLQHTGAAELEVV